MPKRDGTGPEGRGPRTGWGFGPCWGGMRHGWGYWGHHGYRRFASPRNEISVLEEEQKILEEELQAIREELATIKDQQK